jgi:hypothetical protein
VAAIFQEILHYCRCGNGESPLIPAQGGMLGAAWRHPAFRAAIVDVPSGRP